MNPENNTKNYNATPGAWDNLGEVDAPPSAENGEGYNPGNLGDEPAEQPTEDVVEGHVGPGDDNPWSLENMPGDSQDSRDRSGRFGNGTTEIPVEDVGPQTIRQAAQRGEIDPNSVRF